jgi:hypothetical protein
MYIFSRKMLPRARRTSERVTLRLVALWNLKYRLNATYAEPKDAKVERAGKMLEGGASVNESRAEMDLAPFPEDWADTPVLPQGFAPFGYMTSGGAPAGEPVAGAGDGGHGQQPAVNGRQQRALPPGDPKIAAAQWHTQMIANGTDLLTETLMLHIEDQRERLVERTKATRKDGQEVWHGGLENAAFKRRYTDAMEVIVSSVAKCPLFNLQSDDPVLYEVVNGPLAIRAEAWMNDETRDAVEAAVKEGERRSYSTEQIVLGYPKENYAGIAKALDDAAARVPEIARTETVTAVNLAMLRGYKVAGYGHVEVLDADCPGDHGAIWMIDDALRKPVGHENCTRCFAPVA